jgi:HAE1 family hydrophobic/amphiphilic exporter-1
MTLPEFGVKRPVATTVFFIAAVILGAFSLAFISLDLMPAMDIPIVGIITIYKGAGPQEIESRLTRVQEQYLTTVQNLTKIESTSQEGVSFIKMSFDWGTNLDEVTNDVREKLDLARKYVPEAAERPIMFRFDPAMMPITIFGVTAEESYPRLKKIVRDEIARPLERIAGVGTVVVRGGAERQIRVMLDAGRMSAYKIPLDQVQMAVMTSNLSVPGGHLETGRTDFLVRVPAEFSKPEDVGETVIGGFEGQVVRLRDIAEIRDMPEEQTSFVEIDRNRGVSLIVQKQSNANTVDTVKAVMEELENLKRNIPSDIKIAVIIDFSIEIKASLSTLQKDLMFAAILVVLILLLFLRNVRAAAIVSISLPTSLIVTFFLMYWAGYTMNMLSLSALAIAVGLVVDDAIVVVDNVHRHLVRGKKAEKAAVDGAGEVSLAVIVATLTNVAIFVPIVFIGGFVGIIFKQMAMILILALMASLVTALLFVPMLTARFMPHGLDTGHTRFGAAVFGWAGRVIDRLEEFYVVLLRASLRHKWKVVAGSLALLAVMMGLSGYVGTEFFPKQDISQVTVDVEMPEGTRKEITGRVIKGMVDAIEKNVPEKNVIMATWGYGAEGIEAIFTQQGSNVGQIIVRLTRPDKRDATAEQIAARLRPLLSDFPGAKVNLLADDPYANFMFGGKPITVEVRGYELDKARKLADGTGELLKSIKGIKDVTISRKEGVPELQIDIDRKKASAMGVNLYQTAMAVNTAFAGATVTKFREGGEEYDVYFKVRSADRDELSDLEQLPVSSVTGEKIPLGNIATVKMGAGPLKIERKDRERVVYVGGDITGRDLGSVANEVQDNFKALMVPEGFSLRMGGAREEQMKSFKWLGLALLLSVLLVYLVMAAQFESFREPFIMLMAMPFGSTGALLALILLGRTLSVMGFVGLILVGGLAVKNGVVLIDYINRLRQSGMSVADAVVEGGKNRLRPVLMTAMAMFFGMLPMASFKGEGSEFWQPFGTCVVGGLVVATMVTMIFCPVLYAVFEGRHERRAAQAGSAHSQERVD